MIGIILKHNDTVARAKSHKHHASCQKVASYKNAIGGSVYNFAVLLDSERYYEVLSASN